MKGVLPCHILHQIVGLQCFESLLCRLDIQHFQQSRGQNLLLLKSDGSTWHLSNRLVGLGQHSCLLCDETNFLSLLRGKTAVLNSGQWSLRAGQDEHSSDRHVQADTGNSLFHYQTHPMEPLLLICFLLGHGILCQLLLRGKKAVIDCGQGIKTTENQIDRLLLHCRPQLPRQSFSRQWNCTQIQRSTLLLEMAGSQLPSSALFDPHQPDSSAA